MTKGDRIHVGCCGFCLKQKEYFSKFRLLEVQKTFYKPPRVETAERWRLQAPEGFTFTVKAWQLITHPPNSPTYRKAGINLPVSSDRFGYFRPTRDVMEAWKATARIALILQARVVVFQTPASFAPTEENVENVYRFFGDVERYGFAFGWEPRGKWPAPLVRKIDEELELIDVVDPFKRLPETKGVAYFRLHGRDGYRYRYTDEDLRHLLSLCSEFDEVYCLFNNVYMAEDAIRFMEMLEER